MFKSIFCHNFKTTLRSRDALLWLLLFPLFLGTIFYFALGDISEYATLHKQNVAVVHISDCPAFEEMLKATSNYKHGNVGEKDIFNVEELTMEKATEQLENEKIRGIIVIDGDNTGILISNYEASSVIQSFMNSYETHKSSITSILSETNPPPNELPTVIYNIVNDLQKDISVIQEKNISKNSTNSVIIYFYALLAMSILYFSVGGAHIIQQTQPNQSTIGQRQTVSPVSRWKLFLAVYLGNLICFVAILAIVLCYLMFALKVKFENLPLVILTCLVSLIMATSFGMLIGASCKKNENAKITICILITMIMSFFAGLMSTAVKANITLNAPIINWLNPAALITDCFYALYYYDTLTMFWSKLAVIGAFAILFTGITLLIIRRKNYARI